jgi:undecaprenyl-diphosphatase
VGSALLAVLLLAWARLWTGSWRGAARAGLLLAVPWAVAEAVKLVVRRPRPEPAALTHLIVPDPFTFSFPSGHTAFAAALVCAVVLSLAGIRTRRAAAVAGAVVVLAVAWSRVYLGLHYPTDVVAAMVLAVSVAVPLNTVLVRFGRSASMRHRLPEGSR